MARNYFSIEWRRVVTDAEAHRIFEEFKEDGETWAEFLRHALSINNGDWIPLDDYAEDLHSQITHIEDIREHDEDPGEYDEWLADLRAELIALEPYLTKEVA